MDTETDLDWQPPDWWLQHPDETAFRGALDARQYCSDRRDPLVRHIKETQLQAWREWAADPEAYRQARIAEIRAAVNKARRPTSHAIARRLLELPDLPLVHHDDWTLFPVRSVRVDDAADVFVDGHHVTVAAVILGEDDDAA
jgi:hypothetical protein